ncbi:hypothetical protein, partial [Novosphingobium resinovorum]|uniref:hypothetical protein n=1 Tax=Novosphingobium resinovorum TaxID=158500 RepID=UPI002ED02E1B|nr:hypothetical protein [Novosphingobium resinovorum]
YKRRANHVRNKQHRHRCLITKITSPNLPRRFNRNVEDFYRLPIKRNFQLSYLSPWRFTDDAEVPACVADPSSAN